MTAMLDDWRTLAACRNRPAPFFTDAPEGIREAKGICRRCPVVDACLSEALKFDSEGVWGGKTREERRRMGQGRQRGQDGRYETRLNRARICLQRLDPDHPRYPDFCVVLHAIINRPWDSPAAIAVRVGKSKSWVQHMLQEAWEAATGEPLKLSREMDRSGEL